ncbi:hypothetical protein GCM10009808_10000 [Microbacterium sediminicola]|uniref:Chitin-binding type-3 domain-containing protein n=1 Tax=Microbacterium sediminicola TaxID=415210 RepID=A0ABN2HXK5_9MICO
MSVRSPFLPATVATLALLAAGLVAALPAQADAAVAECAPEWSASTVYWGGDTASAEGVNYRANWWSRGDSPVTHNGVAGTGQPWTIVGACGDADPTPTPTVTPSSTPAPSPTASAAPSATPTSTPSPTPTATCTAAAWKDSTVYWGGDLASIGSVTYRANWWTLGSDPETSSGAAGSGQPWTVVTGCEASDPTPEPTVTAEPTPEPSSTVLPTPEPSEPGETGVSPDFVFSAYKDVTINMDWNTLEMNTLVTGERLALVGDGGLLDSDLTALDAVTLAFATGQCGSENWGGVAGADFAAANVPILDAADVDYVISTGGANGGFHCDSGAGLAAFIDRYASDNLTGVDFDIEAGQAVADIQALAEAAAAIEDSYPGLRFSFTIATLAASDGSLGGVNATGDATVHAVRDSGLENYTINLMVMNYGTAGAGFCVVDGAGGCDMGASAVQAAKNLHATYGIPLSKIELTPMTGRNNVADEIFTLDDVDTVMAYALTNGLAGVHTWSLDRDTPCDDAWASPVCNSITDGTAPLDYTNRFLAALG